MKEPTTLEIVMIRHAETNYQDIGDRDNCDGELTPNGEIQCSILGEKLRDVQFDAYFSSSLLRAFKTAAGVCKAKADHPLIEICPELIECGCTPGYYGCSEAYLARYYDHVRMCEPLYGTETHSFACQTSEENDLRAQKVIDDLKRRFPDGGRIAVFSHHGMLEHLIPTALGIQTQTFHFSLQNISISIVACHSDGSSTLRCANRSDLC